MSDKENIMTEREVKGILEEMVKLQENIHFLNHMATDRQLHTIRKIEMSVDDMIGFLQGSLGH